VARSSVTYRSRRPNQDALRLRLKDLAHTRVSYGYRRLHVLLRREGWLINHKRVYRLYRDEGLALKRNTPKRRRSALHREGRGVVDRPNERWAMDFVHDTLAGGEKFRVLTVIDVFTREALAVEARKIGVIDNDVNLFTVKAAFSTLTNVDFDPDRFVDLISQAAAKRENLKTRLKTAGADGRWPGLGNRSQQHGSARRRH